VRSAPSAAASKPHEFAVARLQQPVVSNRAEAGRWAVSWGTGSVAGESNVAASACYVCYSWGCRGQESSCLCCALRGEAKASAHTAKGSIRTVNHQLLAVAHAAHRPAISFSLHHPRPTGDLLTCPANHHPIAVESAITPLLHAICRGANACHTRLLLSKPTRLAPPPYVLAWQPTRPPRLQLSLICLHLQRPTGHAIVNA
jgi:hypothetical protein